MKYAIQYLPLAKEDLADIVQYISRKLHAPEAASKFLNKLDKAVMELQQHPYAFPIYRAIRPLKTEYRIVMVGNYAVFYVVKADISVVEIHRVVYCRRDIAYIFHKN